MVGALGICYFKMGRYETAAEHKPDYLRVSQAERERAAKRKKCGSGNPPYGHGRRSGNRGTGV